MYQINFETCTADDVITRSIVCHPTMLIDTLRANASIHFNARDTMHDHEAVKIAQRSGNQCRQAANLVANLNGSGKPAEAIDAMDFGEWLAAFSAAAKLNLVPHATTQAIIGRSNHD